MPFSVYILFSEKHDRYYIGQSENVHERLKRHNAGSEKATAPYIPWIILWHAEKPNRAAAVQLERKIKNLSRERLKAFIEKYTKD